MIQLDTIQSIVIEATSHCNIHCPQCPRFDQEGFLTKHLTPAHLDFESFRDNFNLASVPNLRNVTFEGDYGDIMMHPDCAEFFDIFKDIPELWVVTNGSMRSPKWWAELAKQKNILLTFSIDGLEDTNHIYRIGASWKKIMANAQAYIDAGGQAEWKFLVFEHNQHQIEEARALAKSMGFVEFVVKHTNRSWWSGPTWPVKVNGVYSHDIRVSSKSMNIKPREPVAALERYENFKPTRPTCWLDQGDIYINHLGHVLPCCMHSGKTWQQDILSRMWRKIVGDLDAIDITKTHFDDIINGDFYQHRLEQSFEKESTIHPGCVSNCC
jgi:MoaA/NifB/PqqE/SkfB family radical SAM enzyme